MDGCSGTGDVPSATDIELLGVVIVVVSVISPALEADEPSGASGVTPLSGTPAAACGVENEPDAVGDGWLTRSSDNRLLLYGQSDER